MRWARKQFNFGWVPAPGLVTEGCEVQLDGRPADRKETQMNSLKKLFGPRALAATVGTALLAHATVAWGMNCLSVAVSNAKGCNDSNYPTQCSEYSYGIAGCRVLFPNETVYWCCPAADGCGSLQGVDGPPASCWGWCDLQLDPIEKRFHPGQPACALASLRLGLRRGLHGGVRATGTDLCLSKLDPAGTPQHQPRAGCKHDRHALL